MPKHYLLLSLKVLARRPFFTFISIVGISLTLLVLMVVTALFDHQFAAMAPESRQAQTLVMPSAGLFTADGEGQWCCAAGFGLFDRYARNLPGAEHLSIYSSRFPVDSYLGGRKITSSMKRTDSEFWTIFDFTFVEGRPFAADEVANAAMVAVINDATRERFFGGASAVGRTLEANGQRFRIVGVVDNVSALREPPFADIWTPYTTIEGTTYRSALVPLSIGFNAIVMASSPAALRAIHDEFNARMERIDTTAHPEFRDGTFTRIVAPFETRFDAYARGFDPPAERTSADPQGWRVIVLFGVLGLLFVLLPTLNLVNINMSRIMERASEIGVRKAFGASSRTLVGQFVVENVVLTVAGGFVGVALSAVVLRAINASGLIPYSRLGINWRVFGYGLVLAIGFGVISGVYPAWRMSRLHPADALRGGRTMTRHLLRLVWNRKRQNLLLTLEIFLSFVVLFTVVYFVALNYYFWRQPLGFVADRVWAIEVRYPESGPANRRIATPDTAAARVRAAERMQRIEDALSALPNIEATAASWPSTAYESGGWSSSLGDPTRASSWMNIASDRYRDVLGIKVVAGRWFSREDDAATSRPIVINQKLARELFGSADPLNQTLPFGTDDTGPTTLRVIGVIDDFRQSGELGQPGNYMFHRLRLNDGAGGDVLPGVLTIRVTPGTTAQFEEALATTLQPFAPDWTFEIRTMEARRANILSQSVTPLTVMAIIAAFLLLMVALGLTGVVWQSVTRRIQEFGLRRAKGASIQDVRRQVLLELTLMTTLAVAVALAILVQVPLVRQIPGMPPLPMPVLVSSIALCVAVIYLLTLLCGWYPSRLATRIHPAEALHYE